MGRPAWNATGKASPLAMPYITCPGCEGVSYSAALASRRDECPACGTFFEVPRGTHGDTVPDAASRLSVRRHLGGMSEEGDLPPQF